MKYEKPIMDVIELVAEDVIRTSVTGEEKSDGNRYEATSPDEW